MATSWGNDDELFHYENVMNTNKRKAVSKTTEGGGNAAGISSKKANNYKQYGLVSRKYEFDELGAPASQSGCFGCCYAGEQDSGAASYESIQNLMNMIRKSIAKTDIVNLANHVAQKYEEIRKDVNDNLLPGEKPLPPWTAATIVQHIRYHNADPELQTWNTITEYQELAKIAMDASVIRNEETGELKIDPVQAKIYLEYKKQIEAMYKSDPTEKLYYSGGAHFDTKTASEGFISFSGKPLIAQWKL